MKLNNLLKRAFYGMVISEFVMQIYFLMLSLYLGEMIYTISPTEKGVIYDFLAQTITFGVLGLVFGIIAHIFIENKGKTRSSKRELKNLLETVMSVLVTIVLVYGVKGTINGDITAIQAFVEASIATLTLAGFFVIIYFIVSPILNKIDKECVEALNRKLKEKEENK